jgi:hypothetical protein
MAGRIDREELRMLIREALKEALGGGTSPAPSQASEREGDRTSQQRPSPTPARRAEGQTAHFSSGLLTESKVAEIGRTHATIVIGTDVAVTPLARDRAREIKVEIVRQKP